MIYLDLNRNSVAGVCSSLFRKEVEHFRFFLLIILICINITLTSCDNQNKRNVKLEKSLELAEDNSVELLSVLQYYKEKGDTLKYNAARFLIENMYSHGSTNYNGNYIKAIEQAKIEFMNKNELSSPTKFKLDSLRQYIFNLGVTSDVRVMTSEYLIDNIELAFNQWEKRPWHDNYNFEEFCEYVLPYRIASEPLQNWRSRCINQYGYLLDSVYTGSDVIVATRVVCEQLKKEGFKWTMIFSGIDQLSPDFIIKNRIGNCFDIVAVATYVLRSLGIPTQIDSYNFSPETFSSHSWNVVLDSTKINIPFCYTDYLPERGRIESDERKKVKVYRKLFSALTPDCDPLLDFGKGNQIDVSSEYFKYELTIPVSGIARELYLCVFNRGNLQPLLKGVTKNNKVNFGYIEDGNIFILAELSENGKLRAITNPFLFTNGGCHFFNPELDNQIDAILYRSTPISKWMWGRMYRIIGATFYGGNNFNSINHKLYTVCDTPLVARNIYQLNFQGKSYRYIKYVAPQNTPLEIAEISFSSHEKTIPPAKIRTGESYDMYDPEMQWENAFDGDPISYFLSKNEGDSIVFDLGNSYNALTAVCTSRNDDNFIKVNGKYTLYVFSKDHGWTAVATEKTNKECFVAKVPNNALLLLEDHNNKGEKHVFIYNEGKQFFLNML